MSVAPAPLRDDALVDRVGAVWRTLPIAARTWVAFSGGADSTALLAVAAALQARGDLETLGAIHVHHGLIPDAEEWVAHCTRTSEKLGVPLTVRRVEVRATGNGLEAAARDARYGVLGEVLGSGELVVTGHHVRDQAESVLLNMLRGAGVDGMRGIAPLRPLGRGWLARPLLGEEPAVLRAWLRGRRLAWVEDPMNDDTSLSRVFLRDEVLPVLRKRWPMADRTLARVARHQARAARFLAAGHTAAEGHLDCAALARLAPEARAQRLRGWLRDQGASMPSEAILSEMLRQMLGAAADRTPRVDWGPHCLRRFRHQLYLCAAREAPRPSGPIAWRGEPSLAYSGGCLRAAPIRGTGLAGRALATGRCSVRFRAGGEACPTRPGGPRRSLKRLFQEWHVPPWERAYVPLVYVGEELAAVAGHLVCPEFRAGPEEQGWQLSWDRPDAGAGDGRS